MEAINLEWKPFLEDQSNYRLDETSSIKDYFNEEINFNKFKINHCQPSYNLKTKIYVTSSLLKSRKQYTI